MLSYFHKKVYSRTIFLMSKFFVIWDLQLLPGPFNTLFWYEICSKSQKLSLSFSYYVWFYMFLFVNMAFNKRTALTYIVFYFLFCCQTRKLFFATVYSKKMTSFLKQRKENQNKNILLKWRALLSHSSFVFLFYICNYIIFFMLINSIIDISSKISIFLLCFIQTYW